VEAVQLADGTEVAGDRFIVAAGMGTYGLSQMLGWRFPPLYPLKGYTVNIRMLPDKLP
jgi:glycine/D-amino acid oxidase-like deaminating enzyme